ncbi:hypothetical protein OAK57_03200 [Synechococcus sp. AH-551-N23]|nr:hypothetical protein [Synechococcus sp. AH-551-N23]
MNFPLRVLVYGARKSGTTLTQRLLDSELIFCHPSETKIKSWSPHINMDSQVQYNFYFQADTFDAYGVNPESYWQEVAENCQKPETVSKGVY